MFRMQAARLQVEALLRARRLDRTVADLGAPPDPGRRHPPASGGWTRGWGAVGLAASCPKSPGPPPRGGRACRWPPSPRPPPGATWPPWWTPRTPSTSSPPRPRAWSSTACSGCAATRPRPRRERGARAGLVDRAIKAFGLVLEAGGFGVVALDVADVAPADLARLPFTTWRRLQRLVEGRDTAALVVAAAPLARSARGVTLISRRRRRPRRLGRCEPPIAPARRAFAHARHPGFSTPIGIAVFCALVAAVTTGRRRRLRRGGPGRLAAGRGRRGGVVVCDVRGVKRLFGDPPRVAAICRGQAAERGVEAAVAIASTRTAAPSPWRRHHGRHRGAWSEAAAVAPLPLAVLDRVARLEAAAAAATRPSHRRARAAGEDAACRSTPGAAGGSRRLGRSPRCRPSISSSAWARRPGLAGHGARHDARPLTPTAEPQPFAATVASSGRSRRSSRCRSRSARWSIRCAPASIAAGSGRSPCRRRCAS